MSKLERFRVVFEEEASEFIISQGPRKRRRLADICYAIAESPFAEPDYKSNDSDSRSVCHILTEGYAVTYWIDAPIKRIVIVEIERAE